VGSISSSKVTTVYSASTDSSVSFEINGLLTKGDPKWYVSRFILLLAYLNRIFLKKCRANYVKGVAYQYLPNMRDGFGFDAVIVSCVPIGSGLSSSASLEYEICICIFL
jgi:mevalonate kinase